MCGKTLFFIFLNLTLIAFTTGQEKKDLDSFINQLQTGNLGFPKALYAPRNTDNEACNKALAWLNTKKYHKYLAQMIDASDFTPSGVFYSQGNNYGNYDECMNIDFTENGTRVLGKHCSPGLVVPHLVFATLFGVDLKDFGLEETSVVSMSLCVPDACNLDDLQKIVPDSLKFLIFTEALCTTKEDGQEYTTGDILVLSLFCFIASLMICSTCYDVYNYLNKKESIHPLMISFSVFTNGRKLLHVSKGTKEQIQIFHGLKFISMMWIVAGHGFVAWYSVAALNRLDIGSTLQQQYFEYMGAAPLAVDTFFYLSGFLLAYGYLKSEKPKSLQKQIQQVPFMYLHRYIRLTPALAMIYLVTITIMPHLGSGPRYFVGGKAFSDTCRNRWWPFFLYIQNYYNPDDICMTQTWYLSADMQMFIFSPLLLIPLSLHIRKSFQKSMICLMILNVFFTFLPMGIQFADEDYANFNGLDTHSRIINYTIGITMGAYIRIHFDQVFRIKRITNLFIWAVILLEMWGTIMLYEYFVNVSPNFTNKTIYFALMRPAWCIGLSWIVFASFHGYGGFVNWLLSLPLFQVGSRLSYCIYLLHGTIIVNFVLRYRSMQHFGQYEEYMLWCGYMLTSVLLSLIWSLAFESPFITIGKSIINVLTKPFQGKSNG